MDIKSQILDTLTKLPTLTNKELYALYPKVDQGSIRNYKSIFLKGITNGENDENSESVITKTSPGNGKKSKVYTNSNMKEGFQEYAIDPDLVGMNDTELIRHTCRKIVSSMGIDLRIKLQASTLLLQFVDKTGLIKTHQVKNKHAIRFKSMNIKDIGTILGKNPDWRPVQENFEEMSTSNITNNLREMKEIERKSKYAQD